MRTFLFVFTTISVVFFSGCVNVGYNLATRNEEISFYSTEKEVRLGKSLSRAVEKRFPRVEDATAQERVREIGAAIAEVCDRKDVVYRFNIIEHREVNAFALPGGYVYLTSELLATVESDDEIACILAHEVGHITARHTIKRLQAGLGYNVLMILIAREETATKRDVNEAIGLLALQYSREDEILADRLAVRYAGKAGYNPEAMLTFLNRLRKIMREEARREKNKAETHPHLGDRIRVVKEEIGKGIDFVDYINSPRESD